MHTCTCQCTRCVCCHSSVPPSRPDQSNRGTSQREVYSLQSTVRTTVPAVQVVRVRVRHQASFFTGPSIPAHRPSQRQRLRRTNEKNEKGNGTHPVDDEQLAAYVRARVAREEHDGARKVRRRAPPPRGDALRDLAQPDGVREELRVPVRSVCCGSLVSWFVCLRVCGCAVGQSRVVE